MAKSESEEKIRFVVFTDPSSGGKIEIPIKEISRIIDLSVGNNKSRSKTFIGPVYYVKETFDEVIAILAAELKPKPKPRSVNDWLIAIYIRLRGLD